MAVVATEVPVAKKAVCSVSGGCSYNLGNPWCSLHSLLSMRCDNS